MPPALNTIAVDLTPVRPGADNGGAKIMTLALLRELASLARNVDWVLLTAEQSHDELADLDAANVRRQCVVHDSRIRSLAAGFSRRGLLQRLRADLLFCPFTAPFFHDPRVPLVSVIYDLQFADHPEFFSAAELAERDRNTRDAVQAATRLVCISEFVRASVIARVITKSAVPADRVIAIPIQLSRRLPPAAAGVLAPLGLESQRFLIYPANFWKHKNHETLLHAFATIDDPALKLVLTGELGPHMQELRRTCSELRLDSRVVFPGHLPDAEFAALLESSLALIFPSLYEGFGMPLLEAMAAGVPVLCANTSSLPEVAGDAALFFDPRQPAEIASAISRIRTEPGLRQSLIDRGRQRAAAWGTPRDMAAAYLRVFDSITPVR